MTEEEKKAIDYLKKYINWETYGERKLEEDIETVLNLIEKQEAEIKELKKTQENKDKFYKKLSEDNEFYVAEIKKLNFYLSASEQEHNYDLKMIDEVKGEAVKLYKKIKKKDKRIFDLEFALMDMVLQFADESERSINTMGLSALETAFTELNFDNPMPIKKVHKIYKKLAQEYYK